MHIYMYFLQVWHTRLPVPSVHLAPTVKRASPHVATAPRTHTLTGEPSSVTPVMMPLNMLVSLIIICICVVH